MREDRRSQLAGSVRGDRRVFWIRVLAGSVVVLGGGIAATLVFGLSPAVFGALAALASIWLGMWWRSRERRGSSVEVPAASAIGEGIRFTDFAFSDAAPTWRGWRRDVGDVTVEAEKIVMDGLRHRRVVYRPFRARLFHSRHLYWTMVEVTASTEFGEPATAYLVGLRSPRSKFDARPSDVENRGRELMVAINELA